MHDPETVLFAIGDDLRARRDYAMPTDDCGPRTYSCRTRKEESHSY